MHLYLAFSNIIQGNNITKNSLGIELTRSGYCDGAPPTNKNIFFNNFFNNTKDVTFTQYYESCSNSWNTSKTFRKNIVGGPWLGGNYWANYTNTGFSQTCTDTNQDGFCDASYALLSNNIDSIPLTKAPLVQPHAPVAIGDTYSTDEEVPLTISAPGVLANDYDQDGNSLTAILKTNPSSGTIVFNADGSFTYNPTLNFFGTDSFTYYANDGEINSDITTVTINVAPINDLPLLTPIWDRATAVGKTMSFSASGTDPDGDAVTLSADYPNGASFNPATGLFSWTPQSAGSFSARFTATDSQGNSASEDIVILVAPDSAGTVAPLLNTDLVVKQGTSISPAEVEFDGTRYLLVYNESGRIYGRFVTQVGNMLPPFLIYDGMYRWDIHTGI